MGTEDADRLFASKGLNRVVSGSHPEVLGKMFWTRKFTFGEQRGFTRPLLLAGELQEKVIGQERDVLTWILNGHLQRSEQTHPT